MAEKKVGITGRVEIEGDATKDLQGLNAELAEFKSAMDRANEGILKILQALAFMAKGMSGTSTEAKKAATATASMAAEQTKAAAATQKTRVEAGKLEDEIDSAAADSKKLSAGMDGAEKSAKKTSAATHALRADTEILRGLWQRIGHRAFDGLLAGLRGLSGYLTSTLAAANEIDAIFDKMGARGVKNVDRLRVAVVELAGALGEDLLEVAKSVDLAEKLGAGEGAIETARSAWENFRITGMDVNRQLEVSSRIARAFNVQMGEQADLIRLVAQAAQQARVSQDMLWSGISSIGPKIQQLGGSYRDMIAVINASLAEGIKVEEEGPQGMNELLDALISSSAEFGQKLAEFGIVTTNTSPAWKQLKSDINAQEGAFNSLNSEVNNYKRLATEIGLLQDETTQLLNTYDSLKQQSDAGTLSPQQASQFRVATQAVREQNKALAEYDEMSGVVRDAEFRRMDDADQLRVRKEALTDAEARNNIEMRKTQAAADDMGNSLRQSDSELTNLTATLQTEIPAAIKAAIAAEGFPAFIAQLGQTSDAINSLPASVQTLVSTIGPALTAVSAGMAAPIATITGQFQSVENAATNGLNKLKENIGTIATTLMGPVSEGLNQVAGMITQKLNEPFEDGSSIFTRVSAWSAQVSAIIITDFQAVADGDKMLGDVLATWFESSIGFLKAQWPVYIKPLFDSMMDEIRTQQPAIQEFLEGVFKQLAEAAIGAADNVIDGWFDDVFNSLGLSSGTAIPGKLDLTGQAEAAVSSGYSSTSNSTYNINVNGVGDPNAVTAKTMQAISQQDRLGNRDSRLR